MARQWKRIDLHGRRLSEHLGSDASTAGRDGNSCRLHWGDVTGVKITESPFSTAATDNNFNIDAKNFLAELERVLPGGSEQWNGLATSSLPALDPNLNLSYAYFRHGQYTLFAGYEKARQGNVFFAGEHCSINFQGYMEGGAQEGARAANEIITQLTQKTG